MMPDVGNQLHCTLYTFIALGKIMYSNIYSMVLFSIVLSFFSVLIFYCFNKRIRVSPNISGTKKPILLEPYTNVTRLYVCLPAKIVLKRYEGVVYGPS